MKTAAFAILLAAASGTGARAQTLARIDMHASRSELSDDNAGWREGSIAASIRLNSDTTAILGYEHSERFGLSDDYVELRFERHDGRRMAYAALGGASDADFRPEIAFRFGGTAPLDDNWLLLADADLLRFTTGDVGSLRLGAERRWRWADMTTQAFVVGVSGDEQLAGYGMRAEAQASERLRLRLGYADAPEVSENQVTEVAGWSLAAMFELSDALALRADLVAENRGQYDRTEFGLGAAWRF